MGKGPPALSAMPYTYSVFDFSYISRSHPDHQEISSLFTYTKNALSCFREFVICTDPIHLLTSKTEQYSHLRIQLLFDMDISQVSCEAVYNQHYVFWKLQNGLICTQFFPFLFHKLYHKRDIHTFSFTHLPSAVLVLASTK